MHAATHSKIRTENFSYIGLEIGISTVGWRFKRDQIFQYQNNGQINTVDKYRGW